MLEWFKDKIHLQKKLNELQIENKLQRETFEKATREWSQQLLDKDFDLAYKDKRIELKEKTIKNLKERIKELEAPKRKKK